MEGTSSISAFRTVGNAAADEKIPRRVSVNQMPGGRIQPYRLRLRKQRLLAVWPQIYSKAWTSSPSRSHRLYRLQRLSLLHQGFLRPLKPPRFSSSASSAIITVSFGEIVSNLITASVPIPDYATGIPGVGMGSSIAVANGSLDGLFSTPAVNVTSWLAAYSALSIAYANGIAIGQSSVTTAQSSCVITT